MRTRGAISWLLGGTLVLAVLMTAACAEEDDDDGAGTDTDTVADTDADSDTDADTDADAGADGGSSCTPSTVEEVCAKVFACGGWGWTDVEECEASFIGDSGYGTECASESGYFGCVCACIELGCAPFGTCEGTCWVDSCVG
jgi:hypothetical protein